MTLCRAFVLFFACSAFLVRFNSSWLIRLVFLLPSLPYFCYFIIQKALGGESFVLRVVYDLGIVFVKFGQLFSTREDLIGAQNAKALAVLRDSLPPIKFSTVSRVICAQFNLLSIEEAFSFLDPIPIATASIAQVHKAVLLNGCNVAVKVLKPSVRKNVKTDYQILLPVAKLLHLFPFFKRISLVDGLKDVFRRLDFESMLDIEASNLELMSSLAVQHKFGVTFPRVHWAYVARDVLVMDWIDGRPIDAVDLSLVEGYQRSEMAKSLLVLFLHQIYRFGFFHADPHYGNVLLTKEQKLALVDFGHVGILNDQERLYFVGIMYFFLKGDYKKMANIYYRAGYLDQDADVDRFAIFCQMIAMRHIKHRKSSKINGMGLMSDLLLATSSFGMRNSIRLASLQRTLVMLEGVLNFIDPDLDVWEVAKPIADQLVLEYFVFDVTSQPHSSLDILRNIKELMGYELSGIKTWILNFIDSINRQ